MFILFQQYGANFVVDEDVELDKRVTFHLENVPLKVSLDHILNSRGYGYTEENGILRITSHKKLEPPDEQKVPRRPKGFTARTFQLRYAPVTNVKAVMENFISPEGKIIADERTRSIILVDTAEQLSEVEALLNETIQTLDQEVPDVVVVPEPEPAQPPQPIQRVIQLNYADPNQLREILLPYLTPNGNIEAFEAKDIKAATGAGGGGVGGGGGIEADFSHTVGSGGYLVVTDIPGSVAAIARAVAELDVPTPQVEIQVHIIESIAATALDLGVDWAAVDKDLDATFSVSNTGGGRLQIGRLTADQFTAVLSALATESDTRLLANPHITVVENQLARFHSGDEIPFRRIVIQQGIEEIDISFKNVGIVLNVMVQVKTDGRINLQVDAQVSSVGEQTAIGEPAINTRNAKTQMLIPDGDTVTIGGLTDERTEETITKVPILGHIPILGGLFNSRRYKKTLKEITIFLTPHIVQE